MLGFYYVFYFLRLRQILYYGPKFTEITIQTCKSVLQKTYLIIV